MKRKFSKEHLDKLKVSRTPKLIFDSDEYSIEKIPLNYRIIVKLPFKHPNWGINRDIYSDVDLPLENAHESVKLYINEFFWRKSDKEYKKAFNDQNKISKLLPEIIK